MPPKIFKCFTCSKSFGRKEHLTRHLRIHTKTKNFLCPVTNCVSRFSRRDEVHRHLRSSIHNLNLNSVKTNKGKLDIYIPTADEPINIGKRRFSMQTMSVPSTPLMLHDDLPRRGSTGGSFMFPPSPQPDDDFKKLLNHCTSTNIIPQSPLNLLNMIPISPSIPQMSAFPATPSLSTSSLSPVNVLMPPLDYINPLDPLDVGLTKRFDDFLIMGTPGIGFSPMQAIAENPIGL